jgi:hypothetical protein
MPAKLITLEDYPSLGGQYCFIQRAVDGYILENSASAGHTLGEFYSQSTVTDKKILLIENPNMPGVYEGSENRVAFDDGKYIVRYCQSDDVIVAVEEWSIRGDAIMDETEWMVTVPVGMNALGASDLVICNNALRLLGNNPINAITDDNKAAKLCLQFYQQTVDAVLRAYTWNCATVGSAALVAATAPTFGFSYAYELPSGCLRVLMISDDDTIKFKIQNGFLLTDEGTAQISYIKRIGADEMDSLLIEVMSARLAATIALGLTNSPTMAESVWKLYKDKLDEAQTVDAFEGTAPQLASNDWINSRG